LNEALGLARGAERARPGAAAADGFRPAVAGNADVEPVRNGYHAGWELFLRHVAEDGPFPSPFLEGAKSVQLAEACYQSDRERRWIDLPVLAM